MAEGRGSAASVSGYTPPRTLRHFRGVVARNVLPSEVPAVRNLALYFVIHDAQGEALYTSERVFGTLNPIWRVIDKDTWTTTMSKSNQHKLEVSLHAVTLPFEPKPGQQGPIEGEREERVARQSLDLRQDLELLGYRMPSPHGGQFPPNAMVLMLSNGFYAPSSLRELLHGAQVGGRVGMHQPLRESPLTESLVEPWMGEAESSGSGGGGGGVAGRETGAGAGAAPARKLVDLSELAAHVTSINSKLSRLHGTVDHRNRTRRQVAQAVEAQAQRKERLRRLAVGLANVVKLRERVALARTELASRRAELTSRREALQASAAELPPASRAVAAARHRCKEAGRLLHGDQGLGRLTTAQQQLCARRWQLVAGLADLYRILAVPASVIGDEGLVMELASVTPGANVQTADTPGAVMTIARVPLDPRLGRRGRADLTKFQEEQAAAALGYAAHACSLLSVYLDVPLRYPVFPGGSCSFVRDVDATPQPAAAKEGPLAMGPLDFPLHGSTAEGAEGNRFAYALFMLNKDLEQLLNAHGAASAGPRHPLHNLQRLLGLATVVTRPTPFAVAAATAERR